MSSSTVRVSVIVSVRLRPSAPPRFSSRSVLAKTVSFEALHVSKAILVESRVAVAIVQARELVAEGDMSERDRHHVLGLALGETTTNDCIPVVALECEGQHRVAPAPQVINEVGCREGEANFGAPFGETCGGRHERSGFAFSARTDPSSEEEKNGAREMSAV
jgi:hypothetical protein